MKLENDRQHCKGNLTRQILVTSKGSCYDGQDELTLTQVKEKTPFVCYNVIQGSTDKLMSLGGTKMSINTSNDQLIGLKI